MVPAAALRPARTVVRWAVRHGLPAVYLERGARRGDPLGRLLRDRAVRDEPHALYEQLRARGPLTVSSLGLVTTSHAVASEILRSEHFGVGWDRSAAPGADPLGPAVRRRARRHGRRRAALHARLSTRPTTPASAAW